MKCRLCAFSTPTTASDGLRLEGDQQLALLRHHVATRHRHVYRQIRSALAEPQVPMLYEGPGERIEARRDALRDLRLVEEARPEWPDPVEAA